MAAEKSVYATAAFRTRRFTKRRETRILKPMNNTPTSYSKHHPFLAKIKERYPLCKAGSKKYTHHVVLDVSHSGITYNVGDSVAIYPSYDANLVQLTLNAMHAAGDEKVVDKHSGNTFSLREFLTRKASITDFSRKLVSEIAARQTNPAKKEHLEYILQEANRDAFKEFQANHELWDLLKDNSEARFELDRKSTRLNSSH